MDHQYIEEQNLADLYLMGRLSADQRAIFEEHFLDCALCLERLETTESFRGGLRDIAAMEGAKVAVRAGLAAAAFNFARRRAVLISLFLLLTAGPILWWTLSRRTTSDLHAQLDQSQRTAASLEQTLKQTEAKSIADRQSLETQLARERELRMQLETEIETIKRPRGAIPSFILSLVRGDDSGRPVNRIAPPPNAPSILLSPEVEPDPEILVYRAQLLSHGNQPLLSAEQLRPNRKGNLSILVKTSLLQPGQYSIVVEGRARDGRYGSVGRYPFLIVK